MATHSSIFAWRIPWTGEPGRLQPMGWQRVTHDLATTQTDVLFILLLIPSSVLSVCSYFISSRSLVNICYIFSIVFQRSWIILTIVILNSFSGMLPISTSFSCFLWNFILLLNLGQNFLVLHLSQFSFVWFLFQPQQSCGSSCFFCLPSDGGG